MSVSTRTSTRGGRYISIFLVLLSIEAALGLVPSL
jgi:hypothetical protein